MAEETVTAEDLLIAQAMEEMTKSANRVSTKSVLVEVVNFLNSDAKTYKHFEAKYPTITVARLRQLVKKNSAISGKVWPIATDEFGICLVKVA